LGINSCLAAEDRKSSSRRVIFRSGGEVYMLALPPVWALQANLRQDPKSLVWYDQTRTGIAAENRWLIETFSDSSSEVIRNATIRRLALRLRQSSRKIRHSVPKDSEKIASVVSRSQIFP
jgi:hypothetical protein